MARTSRSELHNKKKKGKRKKRRFGFRTFLGILLILFALALFAMDPLKNYMIQRAQTQNAIGNLSLEQVQRNQAADVSFDWDNIRTLDAYTVISQNVNPEDLPTIGGVAIPSVNMNLPINKGTDEASMYLGAGTLFPDQEMGVSNYPIASHHSIHEDLLFAPLMKVKHGDVVYLTDLEYIYVYEIDNIQTVPATAVEVLDPTPTPILTMITCDYGLVDRVVVQASMKDKVPIAEASSEMVSAFNLPQTIDDGTNS
ncbi:TPA: class A sortase [Streptococcus suis]